MKLEDLKPDTKNANKGTARGRGMLEKSLRNYGAGRSILADKDGNVIAGNKTLEVAAELGLPVKVVKTNGTELVVVQRTDLDINSKAGRELAIADNRVGQVDLEWDSEALNSMIGEGVDLSSFFSPDELGKIPGIDPSLLPTKDAAPAPDQTEDLSSGWVVIIKCPNETAQAELLKEMSERGLEVRATVY